MQGALEHLPEAGTRSLLEAVVDTVPWEDGADDVAEKGSGEPPDADAPDDMVLAVPVGATVIALPPLEDMVLAVPVGATVIALPPLEDIVLAIPVGATVITLPPLEDVAFAVPV